MSLRHKAFTGTLCRSDRDLAEFGYVNKEYPDPCRAPHLNCDGHAVAGAIQVTRKEDRHVRNNYRWSRARANSVHRWTRCRTT